MKKFLKKGVVLTCLISILYLSLGFLADGFTDPFYLRFTSKKQHSLILGTSRTAQAIQPEILKQYLKNENFKSIYNFSFTVNHSPYGEVYLNAIKSKIDSTKSDGIFILGVDPWSISSRTDISFLREERLQLAKVSEFNTSPNYDYLLNAYQGSLISILKPKFKKTQKMILREDGWLEVNVSMLNTDVQNRINRKVVEYTEDNLPFYKIDNNRINYLRKIIKFLKKYGEVLLIRLPVHNNILEIENTLSPDFDIKIDSLSRKENTTYLNWMHKRNQYLYTDGNHLYKKSGKTLTRELAITINNLYN